MSLPDNPNPILSVEKIKKHFGNLKVLDGISFSVAAGEILGIAGPNGAGKTTLFNVITGMLPLTDGNIYFNRKDITKLKPHLICKRGISRTFQTPAVFPTLTVRDNVRVGAIFGKPKREKEIDARVDQTIRLMGLEAIQTSLGENLNLYQRKLVMLASVVATDPQLLLLDEPAAGLHQEEIDSFMKIISKLNRELKLSVMIIEHLIDWLRSISTQMLILHNGVIMAYGEPEEVIRHESVIEVYLGRADTVG